MPTAETTVWHPASFLSRAKNDREQEKFALLILNQPIDKSAAFHCLWQKAIYRIAADGGANRLFDACGVNARHYLPHRVHGDLDSMRSDVGLAYKQWGVRITKDDDQYSTDLGKCLDKINEFTVEQGLSPLNVVILGGLGGRVDQGFSLMHQLFKTATENPKDGGRLILVSSESISFVISAGRNIIHTPLDELAENVGIIPLAGAAVISTKGLEWDVTDWKTDFVAQVSTSNHIKAPEIEITTNQAVLFTVELSKTLQDESLELKEESFELEL